MGTVCEPKQGTKKKASVVQKLWHAVSDLHQHLLFKNHNLSDLTVNGELVSTFVWWNTSVSSRVKWGLVFFDYKNVYITKEMLTSENMSI